MPFGNLAWWVDCREHCHHILTSTTDLDHYDCNRVYFPWVSLGDRDAKTRHIDIGTSPRSPRTIPMTDCPFTAVRKNDTSTFILGYRMNTAELLLSSSRAGPPPGKCTRRTSGDDPYIAITAIAPLPALALALLPVVPKLQVYPSLAFVAPQGAQTNRTQRARARG